MRLLDVVVLSPLALSLWQRILVIAGISAMISLGALKLTRQRRVAKWLGSMAPGMLVISAMTYIELATPMGPISVVLLPTLVLALVVGWLSATAAIYFAEDHEW